MILRHIDKAVEAIAVFVFAASTVLICINVINRYFVLEFMRGISRSYEWFTPVYLSVRGALGSVSVTADEVPGLLLVWISFLGAYLALRREGHINFDMLVKKLPKGFQSLFTLITTTLIVAFFGALLWQSVRMIQVSGRTEIETMEIAQGYFMAILPIASVLFIIAVIYRTFKSFRD